MRCSRPGGDRVGRVRSDSTVGLLIDALPAAPVLTTTTAAELVDGSFQAANQAIGRLVEAGATVAGERRAPKPCLRGA